MITYTYEDPFEGKEVAQYQTREEFLIAHDIYEKLLPVEYKGAIKITVLLEDCPACITVLKEAEEQASEVS
jgi:hypothetical protein